MRHLWLAGWGLVGLNPHQALHILLLEVSEPHPQGAPCLLADLGCGSGLSTAALLSLGGSRHAVVGLDAAGGMLTLAAQDPALRGCLARSDFGQGLPLRRASLQGAISVSALQWLFAAPDPARATRRFFADLHAALEPGARAAFQLYLPGERPRAGVRFCSAAWRWL